MRDSTTRWRLSRPGPTTTSRSRSRCPSSLARMRAVRRRVEGERRPPVVRFDDLEVDLGRQLVRIGGADLHLTPTEYRLLEAFVTHPGKLLTHRWLLQRAWGSGYSTEHQYLRVFIRQLRAKLSDDPARPRFIVTEAGLGYRWKPDPTSILRSPYRDPVPIIEIHGLPPDRGLDVSTALAEVTAAVAAYLGEEPRGTWVIWRPVEPGAYAEGADAPHAASRNASRDRRRVRRPPRRHAPAPPCGRAGCRRGLRPRRGQRGRPPHRSRARSCVLGRLSARLRT